MGGVLSFEAGRARRATLPSQPASQAPARGPRSGAPCGWHGQVGSGSAALAAARERNERLLRRIAEASGADG
jgi:hypothetical protein